MLDVQNSMIYTVFIRPNIYGIKEIVFRQKPRSIFQILTLRPGYTVVKEIFI